MNMTPNFEPEDNLDAMLRSHHPTLADDGFSRSVLRAMKRKQRQRYFILGTLGFIGALLTIFLFPSGELLSGFANASENIDALGQGNLALGGIIAAGMVWFFVEEA